MLVGSLDAPNQTLLVDCHPLDSGSNVNSSIILHTVDDILRQLEIKRKNFSLFLTDAARYMSLAGKTLKELYLSLMHVTCVAHLLHNFAMRVRAHLKNIDEIIATIKAATIKNKDRKKDFHDAGLPSPPDPVITRWATWLRAALYSGMWKRLFLKRFRFHQQKTKKRPLTIFSNFCGSVACLLLHFIILRTQKPSFIATTLPTSLELIILNYSVLLFLRYQKSS